MFHYWIVPISRGFSVVIVEQATESLTPDQRTIGLVIVGRLDKRTAKTLMWALDVVMSDVLADEFSQVRLTERDDAVETVLLDRADEAFDERVPSKCWNTPNIRRFNFGTLRVVAIPHLGGLHHRYQRAV